MTDDERQNGVALAYGSARLTASGNLTVLILCSLGIIGAVLFTGWRGEQSWIGLHAQTRTLIKESGAQSALDHAAVIRGQDTVACILTLTQEDRTALRQRYSPGIFSALCPWVKP